MDFPIINQPFLLGIPPPFIKGNSIEPPKKTPCLRPILLSEINEDPEVRRRDRNGYTRYGLPLRNDGHAGDTIFQ